MPQKISSLVFVILLTVFNNILKGQVSLNQNGQYNVTNQSFDTIASNYWCIKQQNGKLGMINALGNWVVAPVYNEIGNANLKYLDPYKLGWESGTLIVNKQGKYGAINCYGKEVITCMYANPPYYTNGHFYVEDAKGKYLMFDRFGQLLKTKPIANKIPLENGLTWIRLNEKYNDSEWITNSYALVSTSRDTLFKLKNARYIFNILGTSEGMTAFILYPVVQGGLGDNRGTIGFLDSTGKIVVPPIYSAKYIHGGLGMSAWEYKPAFHAGRALVFEGEQGVYIDKKGNKVLDFSQKMGGYRVYNDFNAYGYTLVYHWLEEDEKSILHKEIIDINGQIVLDITDGVFGEDGLEYTDINYYNHFFMVNKAGKTLYNSQLQQQFFIPREDSLNKYYFFSYPGAIFTCIIRKNKLTGVKDYSFIDQIGKELYPYRSVNSYFDPFTETEISKEGGLLTMKNKQGDIVFTCDSCGYSAIFEMVQNSHYFYNQGGVFYIYKGKGVQRVNYLGKILDEFTLPNPDQPTFFNMEEQIKRYNTIKQSEPIKINVTQKELDSLYDQMPWKKLR